MQKGRKQRNPAAAPEVPGESPGHFPSSREIPRAIFPGGFPEFPGCRDSPGKFPGKRLPQPKKLAPGGGIKWSFLPFCVEIILAAKSNIGGAVLPLLMVNPFHLHFFQYFVRILTSQLELSTPIIQMRLTYDNQKVRDIFSRVLNIRFSLDSPMRSPLST